MIIFVEKFHKLQESSGQQDELIISSNRKCVWEYDAVFLTMSLIENFYFGMVP